MKKFVCGLVFLVATTGVYGQRLPSSVVPEHYELKFIPDLAAESFRGEETIDVQVKEAVSAITLNALGLELGDVRISSGGITETARVRLEPAREMAMLELASALRPGPAKLRIQFSGKLNDKLRGLYLGRANNRKYALTQFEPTDARRAFPSFDEPAMKATFDISVVADKGDTAISNGRIVSDTPGPGEGKHTIRFTTTARLSSYLVALEVGDFACTEGGADGVPIRVCATPDKVKLGHYALSAAEAILKFYDGYYGIKYPFGKLDLIALPDFEAGAMENAGAITFRESALLLDEGAASEWSRQGVAETIAHEMAHQWFGDLVTMDWWNNIWLNEGFATWMTEKPIRAWKPEWKVELHEPEGTNGALDDDSVASTRPIRARLAETSAEINELFDGIAYGKTAAVLRMIEAYVGEATFRRGINVYLAKHAYANATAEDFWNAITEVSGKAVNRIMPTFVNQAGAPLVAVETRFEGGATTVTLSQRRYFFDRSLFEAGTNELWQIPVCMKWPDAASPGGVHSECFLLSERKQEVKIKGGVPWVFADAGAKGYYRLAYGGAAMRALTAAAERDLTPQERIALLGDDWALVRINLQPVGDYLALVEALHADPTPAVVEAPLGYLSYIADTLVEPGDEAAYRAWVRRLLSPLARELGWKSSAGEDRERRILRTTVMGALGYAGRDPEVLAKARDLASQAMRDPGSVDSTLADAAVPLAALDGDAALYDEFLAAAKRAKTPEDYYRFLFALTSFRDKTLLARTLDYALTDQVRNQDAGGLISSAMSNPAGRELGWAFVKSHWEEIQAKLSIWGSAYIVGSTRAFCAPDLREDVKQFFTAHKVEAADRTLRESLETIDYCVDLKAQQTAPLAQRLKGQGQAAGN